MSTPPENRGRGSTILGPDAPKIPTTHTPRAARRNDGTSSLIRRLKAILGDAGVSDDEATLSLLSRDFLRGARGTHEVMAAALPLAVVLPKSTEQVAAVVRIAAAERVPIVEFGGGTGLMGGARTVEPGIVLDLRELNRVIEVNAQDRTAYVQAGVVLEDLGLALEPHGLIVGHDPWTYPIATVGGTISTNSLGYLGARYGSMGDQVLGLTVVLADGSVVSTRPAARSSTGPRLRHLFIGAEGTLGIITEAVLRVFPKPEARRLVSYTFDGFDEGWRAIQAIVALGITPAMVDFGQTYSGDWEGSVPVTPTGERGLLHLAFEGLTEEVRAVARRAGALLRAGGGIRLPVSRSRTFWQNRHVVAQEIAARRIRSASSEDDWPGPGLLFDFLHVSLPASQVLECKRRSEPLLIQRGISIGEWGLWNQPELFSMTLYRRAQSADDREWFADGIDAVLRLVQDLGGSMEYCHGAGIRLAHLNEREQGSGMSLLRTIKRAVDPDSLLNPGKLGL